MKRIQIFSTVLICLVLSGFVSSLQVPFGHKSQSVQQQPQQHQRLQSQATQTSSLVDELLRELGEHRPSSYDVHQRRINALFSSFETSTSKVGIDEFVSMLQQQSSSCFFFASKFDDINDSENTNINDKFWRSAVKYGRLSIDTNGKSENLHRTSELQRAGPFVVSSSSIEPDMYVTMPIPLGVVRYTYSINRMGGAQRVTFLEFQWIVMGKMVYNRVINREEEWNVRYNGVSASKDQYGLTYIDIRNVDTISDGNYDRSIAVKSAIPKGVSAQDYCVGDPSLTMVTNVDLGTDKKVEMLKKASSIVASCLSKPESYVAIAILDKQSIIWGGEDTPCMLGTLNSLGSISLENNRAVMEKITELYEPHGVKADRIYITFNDIARENMGYNGKTFAG